MLAGRKTVIEAADNIQTAAQQIAGRLQALLLAALGIALAALLVAANALARAHNG